MPNPSYTQAKILTAIEIIQKQMGGLVIDVNKHEKAIQELTIIVKQNNKILEDHVLLAGGADKLNELLQGVAKDRQEELWREKLFHRIWQSLLGIALFMGGVATLIYAIAYLFYHVG